MENRCFFRFLQNNLHHFLCQRSFNKWNLPKKVVNEIVNKRPRSSEELKDIPGLSVTKIEEFGEDIIIKKLEKPKGFIARKLSSSIDNQVDGIANILEERAQWQKFGL